MNGKLVRDRIPDIIKSNGDVPITRILDKDEYLVELDKKLQEEVNEYLENNDLAELADVAEVIRAIIKARGSSYEAVEEIRKQKLVERGGFEKQIYWSPKS